MSEVLELSARTEVRGKRVLSMLIEAGFQCRFEAVLEGGLEVLDVRGGGLNYAYKVVVQPKDGELHVMTDVDADVLQGDRLEALEVANRANSHLSGLATVTVNDQDNTLFFDRRVDCHGELIAEQLVDGLRTLDRVVTGVTFIEFENGLM